MDTGKLNRIKAKMQEQGMPQMIISDPVASDLLSYRTLDPSW